MKLYSLCKPMLAALLVMLTAQTALAQDAFYIYRNDGEFNGFFYDDVVSMQYSKIGLDSVEHDEYVVQEVALADTVYRIPLCAIDSIGFQQPEVKFNPRMKDMDELGLAAYMSDFSTYQDRSVFFRLSPETPAHLVPAVGDVLVNFTDPALRYEEQTAEEFSGLACKVKSIYHYDASSQWTIFCDPVDDLSDIFVQLISVEKLGYDPVTGQVKRRVAGFDFDERTRRYVPRRASGGGISLFDISTSFHRDADWGNVSADFNIKAGIDVTYNITWRHIYFKLGRSFGFSVTPSASLKYSSDFEYEVSGIPEALSSIKFPAIAPIFQTRPFPKMFLRGGGELGVKLTLPTVGYDYHESLSFNSDNIFPWRYSMFETPNEGGSEEKELFNTGDVELALSGFVQFGTKFTAAVETNDWFTSIMWAYIGLELFVGPKIEGSLNLSMARLLQQGAYESLSNSMIAFHPISLDLAAKSKVKFFWNDPDETTFFDASTQFGSMQYYLFPAFSKTSVSFDQESGNVGCFTNAERKVFWRSHLGFAAYRAGELVETVFPAECRLGIPAKPYSATFAQMEPGHYQIVPMVKTFNVQLPVWSEAKDVRVTPFLKVSPKELLFPFEGGEQIVGLQTNATTISGGGHGGVYDTRAVISKTGKQLVVTAEPNYSIMPRNEIINIVASSDGAGYAKDTIKFHQEGDDGSHVRYVCIRAGQWSQFVVQEGDHLMANYKGIPCTATRNGDFINLKGSHSFDVPNTVLPGTRYTGSESVSLTIDTSGDVPRVVSGTAVYHSQLPKSIVKNGEIVGQATETTDWSVNFGDIPMSESGMPNDAGYEYNGRAMPYEYNFKHHWTDADGSHTETHTLSDWLIELEIYINFDY